MSNSKEKQCHIWDLSEDQGSRGALGYGSHGSLGHFIGVVMLDGIRAAGLEKELRYEEEQSLPSLRSDGAVLRGPIEHSVPVGQLELKLPLPNREKKFAKHCGQTYDYLKENRHAISPIALLTYYEEWYKCFLNSHSIFSIHFLFLGTSENYPKKITPHTPHNGL